MANVRIGDLDPVDFGDLGVNAVIEVEDQDLTAPMSRRLLLADLADANATAVIDSLQPSGSKTVVSTVSTDLFSIAIPAGNWLQLRCFVGIIATDGSVHNAFREFTYTALNVGGTSSTNVGASGSSADIPTPTINTSLSSDVATIAVQLTSTRPMKAQWKIEMIHGDYSPVVTIL